LALACPAFARADVGVPMIFVEWPAMFMALVPVILIESAVYRKQLGVRYWKALWPASAANLLSTAIGYPLAWGLRLAVQMVVSGTWNPAVNGSSIWMNLVGIITCSAWLEPARETLWIVPAAALVGLVPAYFISVYSEAWVLSKFFKDRGRASVTGVSYKANLASYAFLAACAVAWLVQLRVG
jgi:hypothetical protein